MTSGAD
jgi:hypothetical protein